MAELCRTVMGVGSLFLWLALLVALIETGLVLWTKWKALKAPPPTPAKGFDPDKWAKFVEALTRLLTALKDLPAWVAILLAGLALVWTATSATGLCPP